MYQPLGLLIPLIFSLFEKWCATISIHHTSTTCYWNNMVPSDLNDLTYYYPWSMFHIELHLYQPMFSTLNTYHPKVSDFIAISLSTLTFSKTLTYNSKLLFLWFSWQISIYTLN
jgi:hypothetical protein